MMPIRAILFGILLVLLGYLGYARTDVLGGEIDNGHGTALIPAGFGVALALLGLIGLAGAAARKHSMHLAAMVALLGTLGGLYPPIKNSFNFAAPSTKIGVAMAVVCALFLALCVKSFRDARMAREATHEVPF